MNVTFKTIRYRNFLKTGDAWTTINLDENQFTVIVGKNGVGKSTLIDAICYVLFNKPLRKVNLSQLINTHNKKNSLVEIMFSVGGSDYLVRRGQKPKVFEIYKDKELIKEDPSTGSYQDFLEKNILHMNYQTFTQINILGKATWKPFMQLDAKDRRTVVEEILDSRIYSVMATLAKEDIKTLKEEISSSRTAFTIAKNNLDAARMVLEEYIKSRDASLDILKKQILETKNEITSKQEEKNEIRQKIDATQKAYEEANLPDLEKLKDIKRELNSQYAVINSERNNADNIIRKVMHIETCSTCLQPMDENHKSHIMSENKTISEKSVSLLSEITSKIDKVDAAITKHEKILTVIGNLKSEESSLTRDEETLTKYLNRDIASLKEAALKAKASEPDVEWDRKAEELYDAEELYNEQNRRLDLLTKVLKTYLGDDGLKAHIVKDYVPQINTHMNEYLEKMDLFAQFELDEEFNETIRSDYRDTFSYHSFSEGQKLRIDLSILLTWRKIAMNRNSTSSNLLIMDEVLDSSLDDDGVVDFLNILKTMGLAQNVFIISHKASTQDNFDNTITVSLDGNYSNYEFN